MISAKSSTAATTAAANRRDVDPATSTSKKVWWARMANATAPLEKKPKRSDALAEVFCALVDVGMCGAEGRLSVALARARQQLFMVADML